jgi:pyruvate-formate lyase-activating enzyme
LIAKDLLKGMATSESESNKPQDGESLPPPRMVFADEGGKIYDHPELLMVGRSGRHYVMPQESDLITLPEDSKLFTVPERHPVGWDGSRQALIEFGQVRMGSRSLAPNAVSGFLPPGYVRLLLPATSANGRTKTLPMWAYCAVGWQGDGFCTAAVLVDDNPHWSPAKYDDRGLPERVQEVLQQYPDNRLYQHLAKCATEYHCFAAKNLFWNRWEAGLPVSRKCNAGCLGCLSQQPIDSCQSSHDRIDFQPTVQEIVDVAVPHLKTAEAAMVSFGQGCEGEPLTETPLIEKAIRQIREKTRRGTIHLNTNGSMPRSLERLCKAGINSVRISLNSIREDRYNAYYQPSGYRLQDVFESIHRAKQCGVFVHINLLVFPGITDQPMEKEGLTALIHDTRIDVLQLKNLNIDPDYYLDRMPDSEEQGFGLRKMISEFANEFPHLRLGYFNIPKEEFLTPVESLPPSTK